MSEKVWSISTAAHASTAFLSPDFPPHASCEAMIRHGRTRLPPAKIL